MSKVLTLLFNVGGLAGRHDDDLTDRLVSRYSASLFVALCIVVTTTTYVGEPIQCWCPAHFTSAHTSYANAKCLITPTYSLAVHEVLPQSPRPERHINYYVWVPFILLCQACLCVLPSIVWKSSYKGLGFNVPSIIERLQSSQNLGWENRENAVKYVVEQISRYAKGYRNVCCKGADATCCCIGKASGNYLTFCYLFTKLFYVIVIIGQFVALNWFLGMNFALFGLDMMSKAVASGHDDSWTDMERFPKVTMCEFTVRHMQKIHTWVVQCVLPINLFNERIFLLIWFWLAVLSFATLYNFSKWLCKSVFWRPQLNHVRCQLRLKSTERPKDYKAQLIKFTTKYLRRDSVILLRLLSQNVGSVTESEVLKGLWDCFQHPEVEPSCPEPEAGPYIATLREVVAQADGLH